MEAFQLVIKLLASWPGGAAPALWAFVGHGATVPPKLVPPTGTPRCGPAPSPQAVPPTEKEIPLGPLTLLEPFNRLVIPGSVSSSPFLTSQLLFWTPPGPSSPPTPGTEPGTPVLSPDWMTSPSCQEPGRSCLSKDTVAEAHSSPDLPRARASSLR